jgi:hypothetical protein
LPPATFGTVTMLAPRFDDDDAIKEESLCSH